jgi:hypothetical protein
MTTACLGVDSSADGITSLEQLPPEILLHHLVKPYLSPVDVVSLQSTCRHLHAMIGLTPIDPPHRYSFPPAATFVQVGPFFGAFPKLRPRIHSCQVSFECRSTDTSKQGHIRVVTSREMLGVANPQADAVTVTQSAELSSRDWSHEILNFVPYDHDESIMHFLVASGSHLEIKQIYLRTFVFDNISRGDLNQCTLTIDVSEVPTQELSEQFRKLISLPIESSTLKPSRSEAVISELIKRIYCMSLLVGFITFRQLPSEPEYHQFTRTSKPARNCINANNLARLCHALPPEWLRLDGSEGIAFQEYISAFLVSARESIGLTQSELPALETILVYVAKSKHLVLSEERENTHRSIERTTPPRRAPGPGIFGLRQGHAGQPPHWRRFRAAAVGFLFLGSTFTLIRCITRKRR